MPESTIASAVSLKRVLFGVLFCLLIFPAVQAKWSVVSVAPLDGYTLPDAEADFSWEGLQTNTFQPLLERKLETNIGFRPWFVRVRNQLIYWLFYETKVDGIFLGKDNVLFQQGPIDAYFGGKFLGDEEIGFRLKRLRRVQDSLRAHGTQLLFVIAPGKARILTDKLPDTCATRWQRRTNYTAATETMQRLGLNLLDTTPLFLQWKDTTRYPLFPRGGAHWSGYAVTFVADTLFRRIEHLTGKNLPDFTTRGATIATKSHQLRFTDDDLMDLCNLVWNITPYPMAYPNVVFGSQANKHRADVLIVGDSFSQSFYGFYPYYQTLLAPRSRFWYYNESVSWPEETPGETRNVHELNLRDQLAGRDAVVILAMEENLNKLGFGFIDDAFNALCPLTAKDSARIQEIEKDVLRSAEWAPRLAAKAETSGISVEAAAHNEAVYMQNRER